MNDILDAIHAWDRAMCANDAEAIAAFMAPDWTIIGPDGKVNGQEHFLSFIRSGQLTHDVMESHDIDIRLYGDAAIVVARGISGGKFEGTPFHLVERVSGFYRKVNGRWLCHATHLSLIAGE